MQKYFLKFILVVSFTISSAVNIILIENNNLECADFSVGQSGLSRKQNAAINNGITFASPADQVQTYIQDHAYPCPLYTPSNIGHTNPING